MPTLYRHGAFRFYFVSSDRPEPPHIHVMGGGGRAKIWLAPAVRVQKSRRYSRRQIDGFVEVTKKHREAWLAAWRRYFDQA